MNNQHEFAATGNLLHNENLQPRNNLTGTDLCNSLISRAASGATLNLWPSVPDVAEAEASDLFTLRTCPMDCTSKSIESDESE